MATWPGDTSDEAEKHPQWQNGDQKPGEDGAHHPQAKEHQGQVLKQHLGLHSEAHINWRGEGVCDV